MPSCLFTSSIVSSSAARGILPPLALAGVCSTGGAQNLLRGGCDGVARRWLPLAPAPEGALTVAGNERIGLHPVVCMLKPSWEPKWRMTSLTVRWSAWPFRASEATWSSAMPNTGSIAKDAEEIGGDRVGFRRRNRWPSGCCRF